MELYTRLYGVRSQKPLILMILAVRSSNLKETEEEIFIHYHAILNKYFNFCMIFRNEEKEVVKFSTASLSSKTFYYNVCYDIFVYLFRLKMGQQSVN
jgi:hypothetical protein